MPPMFLARVALYGLLFLLIVIVLALKDQREQLENILDILAPGL